MAFNLFKKKKDGVSKPLVKPASSVGVPERRKLVTFDSSSILVSPHVTEKATMLSSDNQYIFKVFPRANKTEIKRAIESLYNVKVIGVKIIIVGGKTRRSGKALGWKKGYKKAIIRIKQGQKIETVTV